MTTVHIASIVDREENLKRVIGALLPQVDRVFVALNNYPSVPIWIKSMRKVHGEVLDNSLKDCAKLLFIHEEEGFCLVLDDDLLVPPSYGRNLHIGHKKHGGVVGYHGKRYPLYSPTFKQWSLNLRCLGNVAEDTQVHVIGTGCIGFDNRQVKLDMSVFDYPGMADLTFSRLCAKQGIPLTVLSHRSNYLTYLPPSNGQTIWRSTTDFSIHTKILREFVG